MTGSSAFRQRMRETRLPAQTALFESCQACGAADKSGCWFDKQPYTRASVKRPKGCLAAGPGDLPDGY